MDVVGSQGLTVEEKQLQLFNELDKQEHYGIHNFVCVSNSHERA